MPTSKIIKEKALEFSNNINDFKASKGWFEKFIVRFFRDYNLN